MIIDISPPVSESLPVWPGERPFEREIRMEIAEGDPVNLSSIRLSPHLGAHADAPWHFAGEGRRIDEQDLEIYVGDCQVIRVDAAPGQSIRPDDLPVPVEAPRVLIRTETFGDPDRFDEDFAALSPELIAHLASRGVRLVGVDTAGVDLLSAEDLVVHRACHEHDVAILERLLLRDVSPGRYELIALPLRIVGLDGSPVRAVLRTV